MSTKKILIIMITSFCSCFIVSHFFFQIILIQGDSMAPTYHHLEFAIVTKNTSAITRGDVILFKCETLDCNLIKRVVGLPGDTIQLKDGVLLINNTPSNVYSSISFAGLTEKPIQLADDEYFVLGDNYESSKDSRYPEIGNVNITSIIGKIYPQR